ncbi:amidohydrolase family protein [Helicobacter turcicus]|uniref:Amidohydrolase family protein n=1 Tax=Helicobacter turcicus TaxID=2867412 RepID=A0ABS7JN43_9HELI|nr:amidohydrolase family protein [Helicobacter turcicus]MBX7490793.1 amidohydrolase family protein [Helicobacter turcicus]MBX7545598.1 amidohydrolase family protein [Helicobacter turcicus]
MIIKGAMVCDANGEQRGDVRIKEGKITQVGRSILPQDNEEILDAENLVLLPGAIDLNTRVSDGILSKENLLKLSHKAAMGGITQALLLPDCKPTLSSELGLELLNAIKEELRAEIIGIAEAVNVESKKLNELALLYKKGAKGIFAKSNTDGNLLRRACEFAEMFDVPMFFACEDESLSANGAMNDGELSSLLGLPAIPTLSETKEVAQMSEMARFMGVKSVFLAIASQRSVEIIQQLKNTLSKKRDQKVQLHLQTSIHHLLLTENLCRNYNTAAKIKPPLKSESTRKQLVESLKKGDIALLTSLQSEKSLTQKDLAFEEAAFGVDMIANFMGLCYTLLVKTEHLTLSEFSRILSFNPANVLGFTQKGLIAQGYDADLVLFDPKATSAVDDTESPYYDSIIHGQVKRVFVGGKEIIF